MEIAIRRLAKHSDKNLYSNLRKIRIEYIKNEAQIEKFCEPKLNAIKLLIDILSRHLDNQEKNLQHERIIEVVLSILGNCTFNNYKTSCLSFDHKIIDILLVILHCSENASILSKSCRLAGNLAQFETIALSLQTKGIALSISNCLQEDANLGVLTMAIRVIRLMWNAKKFRYEILSFGSIYKIMVILHKILHTEYEEAACKKSESIVILKRKNEPDRAISKEKLSLIIEKMDKHDVESNYEITRPDSPKSAKFVLPTAIDKLELVTGIIKCLITLTAASSPQVARSVYADGFGIACLLFLANDCSKLRPTSLNIISNLSANPFAQEFLGINNDLVTNAAALLLNSDDLEKPLESYESRFCLNILCFSSENACNRLKLRRSGVFRSLLSTANTSTCYREKAMLLFMFYQFRFDQLSLDTLIENGFIGVMIKVLGNFIETKEVDHIKFDDPSLDEERKDELKSKQKKRPHIETNFGFNNASSQKMMRYDPGSPSSSSSGYGRNQQFSPSRNSGYSPINSPIRYDDEDSNSDIYSPVCSDNEEENVKNEDFNILTFIYENDEIGKIEESATELDDDASFLKEDEPESEKSKRSENVPELLKQIEEDPIQFVLQLIWKVSIKDSDNFAFVRPENLLIFHKTCTLVQKPNGKAFQIIENILMQSRNFMAILKQNYVTKIYELFRPPYNHMDCYSCSKMKAVSSDLLHAFGLVAESGYGRGEFAHFLLTGDEKIRKRIVVNLIYIISKPEILNDLLFRHQAMDTILDLILAEENLAVDACNGLTVLACNLNIRISSDDDVLHKIIPEEFSEDEDILQFEGERVKFVLEDGEVSFKKETLIQSSEVFQSMLSGNFKESNLNEVKFPNYTVKAMKYFYQVLNLQLTGKLKPIAPKISDMNVILQAYELSILYILTNIQNPLLNVIKIVLNESNVLKIFEWSLRNINQELLISAVCYYLCGNITGTIKLKLFLEANQSQFNGEWKKLIVDTILMKCQPYF